MIGDNRGWRKVRSTRVVRYLVVGCANTLIGVSVIFFCLGALAMPPVPANAAGYAVGFVVSFLLNRRFTFRSRISIRSSVWRYLAVISGAYILNLLVLLMAVDWLSVNVYLAQAIGIGTYFVAVFVGSSFFVFTDTSSQPGFIRGRSDR